MQYASTCPGMTGPLMNEVLIIVMMNSAKYAGTCYFGTSTAYQGDYGRGYGIAISRLAQVMKNWHVSFIMKRVGMDLLNCWMNIIMRVRVRFH